MGVACSELDEEGPPCNIEGSWTWSLVKGGGYIATTNMCGLVVPQCMESKDIWMHAMQKFSAAS